MNKHAPLTVSANGRDYAWPKAPAIAICLDGCEPAYLDAAIAAGLMPALGENKTIGASAHRHDLAALDEPLRSHGGLTEQVVPFIVNRVLPDLPEAPELRNFDAFYYAAMVAAAVEEHA